MKTQDFSKTTAFVILASMLLTLPFVSKSQAPQLVWSNCGHTNEGIQLDKFGNVYLYRNQTGQDSLTKIRPNSTIAWSIINDSYHVGLDGSGNIYCDSGAGFLGNGGIPWLKKYDSTGARQWSVQSPAMYNNTNGMTINICCDATGNIYWFLDYIISGQYIGYTVCLKYSSSGSLLWSKQFTVNPTGQIPLIKMDTAGNSFVFNADYYNAVDHFRISRFDSSGTLAYDDSIYSGKQGNGPVDATFAIDNNMNVWFNYQRDTAGLFKLFTGYVNTSSASNPISQWVHPGNNNYNNIWLFHTSSNVYVVQGGTNSTTYQLSSFGSNGASQNWTKTVPCTYPYGAIVDNAGNIILTTALGTMMGYSGQTGNNIFNLSYNKGCLLDTIAMGYDPLHNYIYITNTEGILKFSYTGVTGIRQLDDNAAALQCYPNPFTSSCTIETGTEMQNAVLKVIDVTGREVARIENVSGRNITLQRNDLPPGLYLVRLENKNGGSLMGKIIIE